MTNTNTQINAIEIVINAGLVTAEEIFNFVMPHRVITRSVLIDTLATQFDVVFPKKTVKEVLAHEFARQVEFDIDLASRMPEEAPCEICGQTSTCETEHGVLCNSCYICKENEAFESATDETPVAETNQEEEVKMMTEQELINYQNDKALENSKHLQKSSHAVFVKPRTAGLTKEVQSMIDGANQSKDEYFESIGNFNVRVEDIMFYAEKKDATREEIRAGKVVRHSSGTNANGEKWEQHIIGEVIVRVPKNYMQIKWFNRNIPNPNKPGQMGAVEWLDMNGYDAEGNRVAYDADFTKQRNNSRKPAEGRGYLVLPIKEGKDGKPRVNLPMDPDKNGGRPWPIFKTADVRYINSKNGRFEDDSMFVADNNAWFNAQLTAYIQVFTGEFAKEDYRNIHAFNKLCTTCAHSVRLFQRDEVYGDLDTSRKSRSIMNPLSILELAQVGGNLPSVVCGLTQQFVDIPATLELNDAEQLEKTGYVDEEGRQRFVGHNQVFIGGKAINKFEYRAQGTKQVAEDCGHYHMNVPKSEEKVAAERAALRAQGKNDYVSPFYKELPQVERQFIQTLANIEGKKIWVPKFPGELSARGIKPLAVRVKSAGLNVVGAPHVFKVADKDFVAPMVAYDTRHADVMSKINQIFFAAFNMWKLDDAQAEAVFALADNKPENLTRYESNRWDSAVNALANAIVRAQEREEARKFPAFAPHFFMTDDVVLSVEQEDGSYVEEKAHLIEIPVEKVMGETMEREDEIGYGLGYKDLLPTEFTRYLNDSALDFVYDVITNGTRYVLTGEDEKDVELAAGALQHMLQIELTQNYYVFADGGRRDASIVSNVKRDADPQSALDNLKACDEVKDYIAGLLGL